jgi:sugar O-acyltransferase (sialic acid O-acetyltransferase NeuD family)
VPDLVILGASAFAREVHDVVEALNVQGAGWNLLGFVDAEASDDGLITARGETVLGGDEVLGDRPPGTHYVIGISGPAARQRLDETATRWGLEAAVLVHPSAVLGGHGVELGPGTIICANASITTNVRIGRHVHVNLNVTIGHDTVLADYVTLNPGANISGNVRLDAGVVVGTGAAIIQGVSVGAGSVVGMGSAVIRTVPAGVTVIGVPAKPLGRPT